MQPNFASLSVNTNHLWYVRAINGTGFSEWARSGFNYLGSHPTLPSIPTQIAPLDDVSISSPEFVWEDQDDATEFRDTNHLWYVRAINGAGFSDWARSGFNFHGSLPSIPTQISPLGDVSINSPEFVWEDQDDTTQFRLWLYDRSLRSVIHLRRQQHV